MKWIWEVLMFTTRDIGTFTRLLFSHAVKDDEFYWPLIGITWVLEFSVNFQKHSNFAYVTCEFHNPIHVSHMYSEGYDEFYWPLISMPWILEFSISSVHRLSVQILNFYEFYNQTSLFSCRLFLLTTISLDLWNSQSRLTKEMVFVIYFRTFFESYVLM